MTKVWKKFSFWDKIRLILGSVGIGSETALFFAEIDNKWKALAGAATVISILITYLAKDDNKNDIVDILEK